MEQLIKNNAFFSLYKRYVEHTEPPLIMHMWSAISAVAGAMGRHVHYPFALGNIYANQYILLVGPPASRKSTAIKLAAELLEKNTNVIFAPDDTGGQRQGLIAAMEGRLDDDKEEASEIMDALSSADFGLNLLNPTSINGQSNKQLDAHCMYAKALEFGSFIGENASDMTRFLIRVWDGDPYKYKLKNSVCALENALLTIGGATTPEEIAKCLPTTAGGQGFLSRMVLVYAPKQGKKLPPSKTRLCPIAKEEVEKIFSWISYTMSGPMLTTKEADEYVDYLYLEGIKIEDSRFTYYKERRFTHVIKLAMCLAAVRCSMQIEKADFQEAHEMLLYTEQFMPDALGEYGMSALSSAKQTLVEYLITIGEPVPAGILNRIMARDLNPRDYSIVLNDLIASGKIVHVNLPKQGACFTAKQSVGDDVLDLLR